MNYCKLRIAWSVIWGLACVLLVVLWLRSYWWRDMVFARNPDVGSTYAASLQGKLRVSLFREHRNSPTDFATWGANTAAAERMSDLLERSPMPQRVRALGFELVNYWNPFAFAIPFWFLVPVFACGAMLPWLRWQFNLRALLTATTVVAVVLGVMVYAARK
jgi:hypothetical protein